MMQKENNNLLLDQQIEDAAIALKEGKLVSFPTETVYGLGADATNDRAVRQVFVAKGRPSDHPLIVHIAHYTLMEEWAQNIPDSAYQLAKHFWPGPLTLVLEKNIHVSSLITGGQQTVALRVPQHPATLALLRSFKGLVGPSANPFGQISPTTAAHVKKHLGNQIHSVLDGGNCQVGIESTIVQLSVGQAPRVLRKGVITSNQIASVLGTKVLEPTAAEIKSKVPGQLKSHYAPKKPLFVIESQHLATAIQSFEPHIRLGILSPSKQMISNHHIWIRSAADPKRYAAELYYHLHHLDHLDINYILVESIPKGTEWDCIADRLQRACSKAPMGKTQNIWRLLHGTTSRYLNGINI